MAQPVTESQNYKRLTATGPVSTGPGGLLGIFVGSASAVPTILLLDGANTLVNTFTPAASTFYPFPARFQSLSVTITGTVDCTVFWGP